MSTRIHLPKALAGRYAPNKNPSSGCNKRFDKESNRGAPAEYKDAVSDL
jgi:hypothetical protein